jgi:hypothetical protein
MRERREGSMGAEVEGITEKKQSMQRESQKEDK